MIYLSYSSDNFVNYTYDQSDDSETLSFNEQDLINVLEDPDVNKDTSLFSKQNQQLVKLKNLKDTLDAKSKNIEYNLLSLSKLPFHASPIEEPPDGKLGSKCNTNPDNDLEKCNDDLYCRPNKIGSTSGTCSIRPETPSDALRFVDNMYIDSEGPSSLLNKVSNVIF